MVNCSCYLLILLRSEARYIENRACQLDAQDFAKEVAELKASGHEILKDVD